MSDSISPADLKATIEAILADLSTIKNKVMTTKGDRRPELPLCGHHQKLPQRQGHVKAEAVPSQSIGS